MRPGELTAADIALFARKILDKADYETLPEGERAGCEAALSAARSYCAAYTGLDLDAVLFEDVAYAVCVAAAEMLDNRQMTAQYTGQNPTVMQILDLHSTNLLPSVGEADDGIS